MASPRVLVTGGAGYIGSHACKALAAAGYQPVAYDNLSRGDRRAVRWGPLEAGDLLDTGRLGDVLRTHRPIAVLHLAAYGFVHESIKRPDLYYRNNFVGTLSLLTAMRSVGLRDIVFCSSCAVYGEVPDAALTEHTRPNPISPYGYTKLAAEHMLSDYQRAFGFRAVTLRCFNAAGVDLDGELRGSDSRILTNILQTASGHLDAVTINGSDYATPDGTCIRDYVHVTDLADAHVRALEALTRGHAPAIYNLGSGQGVTLMELLHKAGAVTQRQIRYKLGPRRPGDPTRAVPDIRLAEQELGWRPRYPLERIIGTAWRRMQERRQGLDEEPESGRQEVTQGHGN